MSFQGNGRFPGWTRTTLRDGKIRWDNPGQSEKREKKKNTEKKEIVERKQTVSRKRRQPCFLIY